MEELIPYLTNGQLVILSEAGHNGFFDQGEAFARLVTSFYATGVGDDSLFEVQPVDFGVEVPFTDLARTLVRRFIVYPIIGIVVVIGLVVWVVRRKRRHL